LDWYWIGYITIKQQDCWLILTNLKTEFFLCVLKEKREDCVDDIATKHSFK